MKSLKLNKRVFLRVFARLIHQLRKADYTNEEKKVFRLVRNTLRDANSETDMSVNGERLYVKTSDITILVGYTRIIISDHIASYTEITLGDDSYNYLRRLFENKISEKQDKFENDILVNKNLFLDKLINKKCGNKNLKL